MRKPAAFISLFLLVVSTLRADCPTPTVYYGWEDISVTYEFPAPGPQPPAYTALSITDLGIADDIHAAFSRWTYANQAENPSNVGFYFGTPGQVRVYALRVNFPGDPANGDHGRAAWTTVGVWEGTDSVAVSDIHLYYDSMSGGIPVTDPSAPNFHTFIQKAAQFEAESLLLLEERHGLVELSPVLQD